MKPIFEHILTYLSFPFQGCINERQKERAVRSRHIEGEAKDHPHHGRRGGNRASAES